MSCNYLKCREKIDALIESSEKNFVSGSYSPSKRFSIMIYSIKTGENTWDYTHGIIYDYVQDKAILTINRNYHRFWHEWVSHPNGKEYLLCGEDYQGYSVVDLSAGKINRLTPDMEGYGFCWDTVKASPDGTKIAVYGCYWASSYDLRIYDFSDPYVMPLPFVEVKSNPGEYLYFEEFKGWKDNNTVWGTIDEIRRKSDGMLFDDVPEEEIKPDDPYVDFDFIDVEVQYKL